MKSRHSSAWDAHTWIHPSSEITATSIPRRPLAIHISPYQSMTVIQWFYMHTSKWGNRQASIALPQLILQPCVLYAWFHQTHPSACTAPLHYPSLRLLLVSSRAIPHPSRKPIYVSLMVAFVIQWSWYYSVLFPAPQDAETAVRFHTSNRTNTQLNFSIKRFDVWKRILLENRCA